MDKDFFPHAERRDTENIAKLPAFSEPISSLAPGARLQFVLGAGGTIFAPGVDESICPRLFSVNAKYQQAGRAYEEDNIIDLRPMLHSIAVHDPIAEEVKKLRESLEKVLRK